MCIAGNRAEKVLERLKITCGYSDIRGNIIIRIRIMFIYPGSGSTNKIFLYSFKYGNSIWKYENNTLYYMGKGDY